MKYVILIPLLILAAIAVVGKIKFDYVDAPFAGDPVTYLSADGEVVEAHFKVDDSVLVSFLPADGDYLKTFLATPVQSASGAKYQSSDDRFVFWSKGGEASIFSDDEQIISGAKTDLKPYTGTNSGRETIYFDPESQTWNDPKGRCQSCTPENGFGIDGQISGTLPVVWQEVSFGLKNDASENPPIEEVRELFDIHYNANPAWYGTHVALDGDLYRIIVATEQADMNFLAPDGALRAWYSVTEVREPQ